MGFIPGMQGKCNIQNSVNAIHHINKLKKKNHIRYRKIFDKLLLPFMIKISRKLKIERNFNFIATTKNPESTSYLMVKI